MISIAVVALLFILLIVFCVISAKNWHWSNIVFLILAYISGVAACAGLAQVLDGRTTVLKQVKQSEETLAQLQKQYNVKINGRPDTSTYSEESLRGLTTVLQLQLHGRGRVWSGTATGGQTKTFTLAEARDLGGDKPVTLKNVVLYAFLNEGGPTPGTVYPKTFIGTVRVTNETEEAWTLKPEFILQDGIYEADGNSWSLYEKMPSDRHDTFINIAGVDIEDENFDLTKYRNLLETKFLPANMLGFAINDPDADVAREAAIAYERFIDTIAFDGLSMGYIENWIEKANRVSGDFAPPPEEVFYKYQFTKKPSVDKSFLVDADGDSATEGPFTRLGLAIDKTLHNGGEVRFNEDDIVLVDSKNATGYVRQDQQVVTPFNQRYEVKELDRIFVRRLYNFPHTLEKLRIHTKELDEKTEVVKSDIKISEGTLEDANQQQEERDLIIGRLRQDNVGLTQDVEVIDELLKKKETQLGSLRQQVSDAEEKLKRSRGDSQ